MFHPTHPLHNKFLLNASGKPRVRYIGWCNKDNFGDTILAELFKRYFSNSLIWPAYPKETLEARFDGWRHKSNSGHFALGGGTLITNRYLDAVENQIRAGRDFFTFGSGCLLGAEVDVAKAARWSRCLNATPFLGVRGPLSAELCASVYKAQHVEIVGDVALAAAEYFPAIERTSDKFRIGVNLGSHKFSKTSPNLETMLRLLAKFRDFDVEFVQIAMHPIDQLKTQEALNAAGIQAVDHISLYEQPALLSQISSLDLVIGERLHASILAHAYGVPAIGLSYDLKHLDHFRAMDQEDCLIVGDDVSEQQLSSIVDETTSGNEALKKRIIIKRDAFHERLEQYVGTVKQRWGMPA